MELEQTEGLPQVLMAGDDAPEELEELEEREGLEELEELEVAAALEVQLQAFGAERRRWVELGGSALVQRRWVEQSPQTSYSW